MARSELQLTSLVHSWNTSLLTGESIHFCYSREIERSFLIATSVLCLCDSCQHTALIQVLMMKYKSVIRI